MSAYSLLNLISTLGQPEPLLLTDGASVYGAAAGGTTLTLTYAAQVGGYTGSAPTRTYNASALGITRPAITGHRAATNFPGDADNASWWYAPLSATAVNAFDFTADWLFISASGYTGNPGDGYGPYPSNLQYILPSLPSPLYAANPTGGIAWGIDPNSIVGGGGQNSGIFPPSSTNLRVIVALGGDQSAMAVQAGVSLPPSGICCVVWHKAGTNAHVYIATPGALTALQSFTSVTTPAWPTLTTPYFVTDRDAYGGMMGMASTANRLVTGILPGTYTTDQIQQVTDAILSGLAGYALPALPPAVVLTGPTGCHGCTAALSWTAATGADAYRVYRRTNGATTELVQTRTGLTWTDTTVALRQSYTYTVRAYNAGGEGPASNVVTVGSCLETPVLTVPSECEGCQATLTWTACDSATGYRLYRTRDWGHDAPAFLPPDQTAPPDPLAGDDGAPAVLIYDGPLLTAVDTDICLGRRYLYQVYAYCPCGTSAASNAGEVVPCCTAVREALPTGTIGRSECC